jgi:hypothetical protein
VASYRSLRFGQRSRISVADDFNPVEDSSNHFTRKLCKLLGLVDGSGVTHAFDKRYSNIWAIHGVIARIINIEIDAAVVD